MDEKIIMEIAKNNIFNFIHKMASILKLFLKKNRISFEGKKKKKETKINKIISDVSKEIGTMKSDSYIY